LSTLNLNQLRQAFPILQETANGHPLVYFDNAATTQKPTLVIDAINQYYQQHNANVHRASHFLSTQATEQFELARSQVQHFINARHSHEIIWTKGTTESINLIAQSYGRSNLSPDDEILVSVMEHHANIVPWQIVAEQTGATLKVIPVTQDNQLDLSAFETLLTHKTKVLAICHASNSIGTINPVKEMIKRAKSVGATTLIDGAQAVAHFAIDVQDIDCDFYCFSGHKMFGPTGIGVLYGKSEYLNNMPPWQAGGEMIERVSFDGTTFNRLPFKFEAGTPNISGAIGLGAAIRFIQSLDSDARVQHEDNLRAIAIKRACAIPNLELVRQVQPTVSLLSFNISGYHASDIGMLLDKQGIAVRTGHHCTMPLMQHLGLDGTLRMSFSFYNTEAEVHHGFDCLEKILAAEKTTGNDSTPVPVSTLPDINALTESLLAARGWESRYRMIMQLGKQLPAYPEHLRSEQHIVPGCDSTVWLSHTQSNSASETITLEFSIDSNARIIKGLSVILLSYYNGRQPEDILSSNVETLFDTLGLSKHLSPSRNNGLHAINQRILAIAQNP